MRGAVAVRRLAERTGGVIILLEEIHSRIHISEESRSTADFLMILAAAGGHYDTNLRQENISAKWTIIDSDDGKVLRNWRTPGACCANREFISRFEP